VRASSARLYTAMQGARSRTLAPVVHTRAALVIGQIVTLKVRRLCALPTCSTDGGQHHLRCCPDPLCLMTERMGGEHSVLLTACNGAAARREQPKLWKQSSAHDPSAWWSFPETAALLEGITLPPDLSGYKLDALELHVRASPCTSGRAGSSMAEPPRSEIVECRRCFMRVPKVATRYDNQLMHRVCSGPAESACRERAPEGRGARKRHRSNEAEEVAWMACDGPCARWFHAACVHVMPSADDQWLCDTCTAAQPDEDIDVLVE